MFAGVSFGAVVWAATQIAARPEKLGKLIVAFLPNTSERYLTSAPLA